MKHQHKPRITLKIAFIMDPMEKLSLEWDNSMAIMLEAQRRGHQILYIEPGDLFVRNDRVFADVRQVHVSRTSGFRILKRANVDLKKACDIVFNRKEPPFDVSYFYLTYILELLEPEVFVINSPSGIRKANEKFYILQFPNWIPPTLVSNKPERIKFFQKQLKSDLILKPLDDKGGAGIVLLPKNSRRSKQILKEATRNGAKWIMAQKFLKQNLIEGDKRILLLNGKVIAYYRKIPKPGEFRANLSLGGKNVHTSLTQREHQLVQALRAKLSADGLYFVGIDVIDGLLLEINVTSPAGLTEFSELEGTHPEIQVVDFLEATARTRAR
ncbi:MAG: glutathione synthase [Omnitrophica bacterium RIFCSPHIGHO2_02_FULL_46_11]|nr:MAG: glutathione synthase [Omnitrophica bacterium RIFCSPHIGHO2_02_FULL_46_11]OGW86786.1 MAG: glutathione synthase [Omnitrophica bacterium RIFCSPLOWO2_01_FULL_45_10b]